MTELTGFMRMHRSEVFALLDDLRLAGAQAEFDAEHLEKCQLAARGEFTERDYSGFVTTIIDLYARNGELLQFNEAWRLAVETRDSTILELERATQSHTDREAALLVSVDAAQARILELAGKCGSLSRENDSLHDQIAGQFAQIFKLERNQKKKSRK